MVYFFYLRAPPISGSSAGSFLSRYPDSTAPYSRQIECWYCDDRVLEKGRVLADKAAVVPSQVKENIEYMIKRKEHLTVTEASIILAELCGVLLGLRRSEHFASSEGKPNQTKLLCFRNLAGTE